MLILLDMPFKRCCFSVEGERYQGDTLRSRAPISYNWSSCLQFEALFQPVRKVGDMFELSLSHFFRREER
jgi:hypothetical protein